MKADEKWPEFMRGDEDSEPTLAAPTEEADQDELHLDLDSLTVDDLGPPAGRRRSPQSLKRRDKRAKKPRRIMPVALAVLAVGVLGTAGAFGYLWFFGDKPDRTAPLVQALDDPVKVKPASPGGLEVPYQDQLVLNKPEGEAAAETTVERLLPPPETPKPPVREPEADAAAPSTAATDPSAEAPPKQTEAVTDAPGTVVAPTPPPTAIVEAPVPAKSPVIEVPAATAPAKSVQTAAAGTYLLQLGSFTSAAGAEGAWAKLQKSFPNLLGDMSLFVQQASVNDKTYHRVQAGPFPNRATALDLCAQLKAEKQDCLVVRR